MSIVSTPKLHVCDGLSGHVRGIWSMPTLGERRYLDGTVRRCDTCGRTWVSHHIPGLVPSIWRRERRIERWSRERRESK